MLFDTNHFSSKKITETQPDPAWDDGSAFPEVDSYIEVEPCLDNSIYAPGSAQGSALQESSSLDLNSLESQKQTNTAQTSSLSDTQESKTTETCLPSPNLEAGDSDEEASTLSQHRHLAPPSQLKGTGKGRKISETVSPQSYESSKITDPNSQPSKTLQDSSTAPTPKAITDITLDSSSTGFTNAGTMRNGFVLAQDSLPPPSLEKGYCWLPSPGALSTGKGRPPGQTKQEAWLKKRGLIQKREVLNPAILCEWYKIPTTWLDPSESLPATELLENSDQQLEIFSILESQRSPLEESSTSKACCPNCEQLLVNPLDGCGICGWIPSQKVLEESKPHSLEKKEPTSTSSSSTAFYEKVLEDDLPHSLEKNLKAEDKATSHIQVTSNSSGSLYRYLKNTKLKSGSIASYPRVEGVRDPDKLDHWYWGYNYKVLEDGVWKSKSKSVPRKKVAMVQRMIENNAPVSAIKAFIRVLEDDSPVSLEKVLEDDSPVSLEKVLEDGSPFSLEKVLEESSPDSLEKVLEDNSVDSLEKFQASGSLYRYLKNKKLKSGVVSSYPRVSGVRDPNNPDHWYWGYSYEVNSDGQWKGRSLSVPRNKVRIVQQMIDSHQPISTIKAFIANK